MSELSLVNWLEIKKLSVNSVPKGTPVFIYSKYLEKKVKNADGIKYSDHADKNKFPESDTANEYFIKREMGLAEEE